MFKHGVYYNEIPTSVIPTLTVAAPTVVVGLAPVHAAENPAPPNTPVLCTTYSDYVEQFGWSGDLTTFTCEEAAYGHFALYNVKPLIVINVLNVSKHTKAATKTVSGVSNAVKIQCKAVLSTVTAKSGDTALINKTDYTVKYDEGELVLTITSKGKGKITGDSVTLSYNEIDASKVTSADIIGGIDAATGKNLGLECINDVYPKYGILPGCVIAPKYSADSEVAAVMKAKVQDINSCFNTICAVDIDTSVVKKYSDVNDYKNTNNLVDKNLVVCWPMVTLGGQKYHLSTHLAAIMSRTDADNGDVPYVSPSNKSLQADGFCLKDGSEILIPKDHADYLNSVGVVTGLNMNGYRLWGNRTSLYPAATDPKDVFICVRRMVAFIGSSIILTFFSFADQPLNRRLVETVESSTQQFLNGLAASEAILGGTVTFSEEDNSLVDLSDGQIKFHLDVGFVSPAEAITFDIQYDPSFYQNLFTT